MRALLVTLALLLGCGVAGSEPKRPQRVEESDYQRWLEASHAEAAAKARLEVLRLELNRKYLLSASDVVEEAAPHAIKRSAK